MSSQNGKQILVGAILGVLLSGVVWYLMKDKRVELEEKIIGNAKLEEEVEKGKRLKASYEVLKKEVEEQEKRIAELVKLLALETERSRVSYMVQKVASASALGPLQGMIPNQKPISREYVKEYQTTFRYPGRYHDFGRFLSFASGFDKIVNISDIVITRNNAKGPYSASIEFCLSVFVYDPTPAQKPKAPAAARPAASGKAED